MSISPGAIAVVTGVSGGIGTAIGRHLRQQGYAVVGIDQTEPNAPGVCDAYIPCDLSKVGVEEGRAARLAKRIDETFPGLPLRALVNNAAVQRVGTTETLDWQDWLETFHVNVSAPFALVRAFLSRLRSARGVVVNIGSVHAVATKPGFIAYATSKAALHGLSRALAVELGPSVRVVAIAPAAVETPMLIAGFAGAPEKFAELKSFHPMARIAEPKEVARVVAFVLSQEAAFMTGSVVVLDGGILARLHDPS